VKVGGLRTRSEYLVSGVRSTEYQPVWQNHPLKVRRRFTPHEDWGPGAN
jgi:hypothetical protein